MKKEDTFCRVVDIPEWCYVHDSKFLIGAKACEAVTEHCCGEAGEYCDSEIHNATTNTKTSFDVMIHAGYGHFFGNRHYYTREPFSIGRIKREANQSLCGATTERLERDDLRRPVECKRCVEIAARLETANV